MFLEFTLHPLVTKVVLLVDVTWLYKATSLRKTLRNDVSIFFLAQKGLPQFSLTGNNLLVHALKEIYILRQESRVSCFSVLVIFTFYFSRDHTFPYYVFVQDFPLLCSCCDSVVMKHIEISLET